MRPASAWPYQFVIAAAVAALAVLPGCTAAGNAPNRASSPPGTPTATPPEPRVAEVTCGPTGTIVSTTRVAAQSDGVHLRVRATTTSPGVQLAYAFPRNGGRVWPGGGDVIGPGATTRVYNIPPGPARLNCVAQSGKNDKPISIEVVDPGAAWRSGALAALGCEAPERSLIDWVYRPGRGTTPEAALKGLAAQLPHPVTWRHVQEGYVDARQQVYVLHRDGKPWVTVSVIRWAGADYAAGMGASCGDLRS